MVLIMWLMCYEFLQAQICCAFGIVALWTAVLGCECLHEVAYRLEFGSDVVVVWLEVSGALFWVELV